MEEERSTAGGSPFDPEDYSPGFLAHKHGISTAQAQDLIERFGRDKGRLDAEAERLKGHSGL